MPPGRPRLGRDAAEARLGRERQRLQAQYECNCTFPGCSGRVSRKTLTRHAEWMEAEVKRAENLAGIHDLAAGYPAPEIQSGLDVRVRDDDVGDSDAEFGDVAVGEAGGEGDVEPVAEFGPLQARSKHRSKMILCMCTQGVWPRGCRNGSTPPTGGRVAFR